MRSWSEEQTEFIKNTSALLTGDAYRQFCERWPDKSYQAFAVKKAKMNCCKAVHRRLKWRKEWLDFIDTTKGVNRLEAWAQFRQLYPDADVTAQAFHNQRSRRGVADKKPHRGNAHKQIYSESTAKGYVQIKVAEPNVWISKARWVYEETHPGELTEKGDKFHFLNANKFDFSPENIFKIKPRERIFFLQLGGSDTDPEVTRVRLAQAKLRLAQFDLGEKTGTVLRTKSGRRFKEDAIRTARKWSSRPENKEKNRERQKQYYYKIKAEGGELWERRKEQHRKSAREWARRNRK